MVHTTTSTAIGRRLGIGTLLLVAACRLNEHPAVPPTPAKRTPDVAAALGRDTTYNMTRAIADSLLANISGSGSDSLRRLLLTPGRAVIGADPSTPLGQQLAALGTAPSRPSGIELVVIAVIPDGGLGRRGLAVRRRSAAYPVDRVILERSNATAARLGAALAWLKRVRADSALDRQVRGTTVVTPLGVLTSVEQARAQAVLDRIALQPAGALNEFTAAQWVEVSMPSADLLQRPRR